MQKLTDLPENIKIAMMNEHERALKRLVHNRDYVYKIPMHTAPFAIIQDDGTTKIEKTIIPPIKVFMDKKHLDKDHEHISRDGIGYRIAYNNAAVPVAHIFEASGWICFGNIFVPSQVSVRTPMVPLETIFLHNDRNKSHGNPAINFDNSQKKLINTWLKTEKLPYDADHDWVSKDTLWKIGRNLLEKYKEKEEAFYIAETLFKLVFK